jgi:hypothetical protein
VVGALLSAVCINNGVEPGKAGVFGCSAACVAVMLVRAVIGCQA